MYLGFLDPFYAAVAWVLIHIHALWSIPFGSSSGAAWALSIVLLTVLMRLLVLPLFIKQMKAQRKLAALQPQVMALRKKYKNDKQTFNQELMKLYQENGANPLMGCLPLLVQLPVFWALFDVLEAVAKNAPQALKFGFTHQLITSAQHADIISATIASRIVTTPLPPYHLAPGPLSAKIVVGVAVAVSATTTFLTMSQSIKRGPAAMMNDPDNPMASSQRYMKYIGPLFAVSGLYWQFGLVLYWVTSNLWTLGQTSILFRKYGPAPAASGAAAVAAPAAGLVAPNVPKAATSRGTTPAQRNGASAPGGKTSAAKVTPPKTPGAQGLSGAPGTNGSRATTPARPTSPASSRSAAGGTPGSTDRRGANAAAKRTAAGKPPVGKQGGPTNGRDVRSGGGAGAALPDGTAANGGGRRVLNRLRKGKVEPEEVPAAPPVKLVRQQRVRQPRSKRSGKR